VTAAAAAAAAAAAVVMAAFSRVVAACVQGNVDGADALGSPSLPLHLQLMLLPRDWAAPRQLLLRGQHLLLVLCPAGH
jgi:hypothetical protein